MLRWLNESQNLESPPHSLLSQILDGLQVILHSIKVLGEIVFKN